MATLDDLRAIGYDVGLSFEGDDFTVYRVDGFGLSMQVRDDDQATVDSLADPQAHGERALQAGETREQTRRRWVRERRIPPPNPQDVT